MSTDTSSKNFLSFTVGGCIAVEKERIRHPWKDFEKTNTYYNKLMRDLRISQFRKDFL